MIALMHDARGVGLAATQVGVLRRVFVFQPNPEHDPVAVVNPRITERGAETSVDEEGCLSLQGVRVPVERATTVTIEAQDAAGATVTLRPRGVRGASRAARVRPSRRRADHRPHRRRAPQAGARRPAAARRPPLSGMRIAVAATAAFGADVLERLAGSHEVDRTADAARCAEGPRPQARRAARQGGRDPSRHPRFPAGTAGAAAGFDAPIVVVCAYGLYIPPSLLDQALWLNVHPSLLPRWRGAAPVERAILAGDESTGVTIHRTVAELDAGPIAAQEAFPLGELDAGGVYERCAEIAARLLDGVLADGPEFEEQPEEGATYAEKIGAGRPRARPGRSCRALRRVRALSPHIGAWATLARRARDQSGARTSRTAGSCLTRFSPRVAAE